VDILEKAILSEIFVSSFTKKDFVKTLNERNLLSDEVLKNKINLLMNNDLVKQDKKTLTELGKSSLRIVLAGGVFDIIHPGHIHTLNSAKALGDVLVVVVATDNTAQKMKKRKPLHNQNQRQELVSSLVMVDLCVVGEENDIFKTVEKIRPQTIALGYDQIHQEKFIIDGCKKLKLDVKVARLQSTIPEISSSKIEEEYGKDIHNL